MLLNIFRRFHQRVPALPAAPEVPRELIVGYEHPELIDVVFRKTIAFQAQPGDETFRKQFGSAKSVLDFGGACGLHYKKANDSNVRWAVVETPAMVQRAYVLSTEKLKFFETVDGAVKWLGSVDVVYSEGAIQYTDDPSATVDELCAIQANVILWRRLTLSDSEGVRRLQISRLSDNGPGKLDGVPDKDVSHCETSISESEFLSRHDGYRLVERDGNSFRFERGP